MNRPDGQKESWHLSKEVPIALIGTLLVTIVSATFAWSKIDSRIEAVEKAQNESKVSATAADLKLDRKLDLIQTSVAELNTRFMQAQIDSARAASRK